MLWPPLILFILAVVCALIARHVVGQAASADERANAEPWWMIALLALALSIVWALVALAWKAFA